MDDNNVQLRHATMQNVEFNKNTTLIMVIIVVFVFILIDVAHVLQGPLEVWKPMSGAQPKHD
jgi:hypothetical protein